LSCHWVMSLGDSVRVRVHELLTRMVDSHGSGGDGDGDGDGRR